VLKRPNLSKQADTWRALAATSEDAFERQALLFLATQAKAHAENPLPDLLIFSDVLLQPSAAARPLAPDRLP
jgi:hypothetical protein